MSEETVNGEVVAALNKIDLRVTSLSADVNALDKGVASIDERLTKLSASTLATTEHMAETYNHLAGRVGSLEERPEPATDIIAAEVAAINDWIDKTDPLLDEYATHLPGLVAMSQEIKEYSREPQFDKIYAALCAAQAEINNAEQNKEMKGDKYSFKYADLASVLDAVRGPLSKNGLALFQVTEDPGNSVLGIRTTLAHGESGQTIQDHITMTPPRNDPQGVGSCRTYMRRYAILALCGIAGAEDDDAERTKPNPDDYDRIGPEQIDELLALADKHFDRDADAKVNRMLDKAFQVTAVGDIPASLFDQAINLLNNQKKREIDEAKKAKRKKKPDLLDDAIPPMGNEVED